MILVQKYNATTYRDLPDKSHARNTRLIALTVRHGFNPAVAACLSVSVPAALCCHGIDLSWNRCRFIRAWNDAPTQASSQDALAPWWRVLTLLFRFLYSLLPGEVLGIRAAPTLAQVGLTGGSRWCPEVVSSRLAVAKQDRMRLCGMVRLATNGGCQLTSSENIVIQGNQVGRRVQEVVILRVVSIASGLFRGNSP